MQTCPLCGNLALRRLTLPHTRAWQCGCQTCGLRFASPQLDQQSVLTAYRTRYYPGSLGVGTDLYELTPRRILEQILQRATTDFGKTSGSRLLDYGCGTGLLCKAALDHGLRPVGIEPDANARAEAGATGNYPVYPTLEGLLATDPNIRFDVIVLWDVIEHLRTPWADVANLRKLLKRDGYVLISTPNAGSAKARLLGRRWDNYLNPTHFYYFTRQSLYSTLQQSGFSKVTPWDAHIRYPHHGAFRRALARLLAALNLQGELLAIGRA